MSDLTDRIAAEHAYEWYLDPDNPKGRVSPACHCGVVFHDMSTEDGEAVFVSHVAGVTEAAIRAKVAADIEVRMGRDAYYDDGMEYAAHIARGGVA